MRKILSFSVAIVVIVLLMASCQTATEPQKIRTPEERLQQWWSSVDSTVALAQNGYLIERGGLDRISAGLRNFNDSDKAFSHAGLVFIENDTPFVYHVYMGDENPQGFTMREQLRSFCNPEKLRSIGLYKYQLSAEQISELHQEVKRLYSEKMKFDKYFNLTTDSTMYCAEFIAKSIAKVTQNKLLIPTTTRKNVSFKEGIFGGQTADKLTYIALDNLYLNPFTTPVKRTVFQ
jgi:hypothetical protein